MKSELTRSGVAYNITISPHKVVLEYDDEEITFVFSSEYYTKIFRRKLEDNRNKIAESLSKRFNVGINFNLLADIKLYEKVEKRGFLIRKGLEEHRCLNTIQLNGQKMTKKNFAE